MLIRLLAPGSASIMVFALRILAVPVCHLISSLHHQTHKSEIPLYLSHVSHVSRFATKEAFSMWFREIHLLKGRRNWLTCHLVTSRIDDTLFVCQKVHSYRPSYLLKIFYWVILAILVLLYCWLCKLSYRNWALYQVQQHTLAIQLKAVYVPTCTLLQGHYSMRETRRVLRK